jgi:signal transduction histidine kinase
MQPPKRTAYVAVASGRACTASASERLPAGDAARQGDDLAWHAAMQSTPFVLLAALFAVACAWVTGAAGHASELWALGAAALGCGLAVVGATPMHPAMPLTQPQRRRVFALLAGLSLLWLAGLGWLPTAEPPTRELAMLRLSAIAAVAAAAAVAFAPLRRLAGLAVALSWLPLAWPVPETTSADAAALTGSALILGVLVAGAAAWARRLWHRQADHHLDAERRLLAVEAARQVAVDADQDKTRLLSAASHDLRQPVHALGLFAATLDKRLRGSREEPLVRNVVQSIEGLDRSLSSMLDISRLDAGSVEPNFQHFPLRDLFRRLHMQFAGRAELAGLSLRFSPGGKWVTSDPQLLERVLANLIQNAMKYTVHGGAVVVARTTATHFHIEVWDTGVGIAAQELPRIFDEYYQVRGHGGLRAQGMGMGLAIVRRLVRLLGHELTVVSRPGRGTMFRLAIAQRGAPEVQDMTAPADTQPMPAGRARSVLLVEDDAPVREGLALLLEEAGYVALPAANLEQARQLLRVLELPPDLLLTDLQLGPGPDGLNVIDEVRRECGFDLPAVVITGDITSSELQRLGEGRVPVLFKPVDPRRLLQHVRSLVA